MRRIVHLDADAFFAAVEQAADPRLRDKPVAVGGEKRGIIASASYEARRFGIYTPMPTSRARKLCPKLILLPGDFEKYEYFSRWMFSYAYDFTPDVEICSIDEGYFDLSGARKPPLEIADIIRRAIRQALKITVSEGIGANKLVSQIASKLNKPAAFFHVPGGQEIPFLHPLPNRWLPGVGPKTAVRLDAAGLTRIRQIAATPADLLSLLVGRAGPQLKQFANGIDERPVVPASEPAKSYSHQQTFAGDQTGEEFLEATLRHMADSLMAKVREDGKSVRTITVKVRYNDMDEDQYSESLVEPTDLETDLYPRLRPMLRQAWKRRVSLRLVSLKFSNLYDGFSRSELPLTQSARQHDARRRLATVIDELREQHGHDVMLRGHDFVLREGEPREQPVKIVVQLKTTVPAPRTSGSIGKPMKRLGELGVPPSGSRAFDDSKRAEISQALPSEDGTPNYPTNTASSYRGQTRRPPSPPSAVELLRRTGLTHPVLPLVVRSQYSFLNSTLSIPAIIGLARKYGLPAVALADQGNLHGAVEFVQAARAANLKPILGAETQWQGKPLWLYVESAKGYANLCRILSQRDRSAEVSSAQAGRDPMLEEFADGLIAVGSDLRLADLFPGRFYLAISHPDDLRRTDAPSHLPRVAVLPVHYAVPEDRWKFDVVQSIRTLTLLRQPHPDKQLNGQFHFRPPDELRALFRDYPELLSHSGEIAGRCSFEFTFGKPQFPAFRPPDSSVPGEYLRKLVFRGAQARYPKSKIANLKSQIEEELRIIAAVGYEEYFLVVWDLLQECRARAIEWITRGSAADSLVCYCLGISTVCPIRFELYFRRFLNQERMALNKLPDIDIDFPHDRKDDVIDLIFQKYGAEHCAVVGGFNTYQARGAVGDVAKVLGVSEYQIRRFTERFPWTGAHGLRELLRQIPECRDLPLDEEPYRSALEMAEFLEGVPRYPKMHPCGVVLSRQPMHELTPTFISSKGYQTTHFDMDAVEAIGLVKMDILAQGGLAVMRDVRSALAARNIEVDLETFVAADVRRRGGNVEGKVGEWESEKTPPTVLPPPESRSSRRKEAHSFEQRNQSVVTGVLPKLSFRRDELCESQTLPVSERSGTHGTRPSVLLSHSPTFSPASRNPPLLFPEKSDRLLVSAATEPWNDPAVWDLIATGNARAVHHIESPAMTSLCRMCNVRDIDTLIAIVSVIRPGAANEDKKREFARRYQGLSPVTYPHPSLEPCLRSTFGLVVYEEHILQICEVFAGLQPGRADVLRRALVKEKADVISEIEKEFSACARSRGHPDEKIAEVWQLVTGFHGYAFCKAHSTAYGVEAYQSAWLKRYFPAEFMAAVLTNGKGFYRPLVYVLECYRLGIPLLPPWVNEPGPGFKVVSGKVGEWVSENSGVSIAHSPTDPLTHSLSFPAAIRVPVTYIKGLSEQTGERILAERTRSDFASLSDFYLRVRPAPEEMEILSRAGAFDGFGQTRPQQFWEIQFLVQRWGHALEPGQGWLNLDECGARSAECGMSRPQTGGLIPHSAFRIPHLAEPARLQRLQWETELLGFTASSHPLELYPDIAWDTYCPVARLGEFVGQEVTLCGLIIEDRVHHQSTGEPMKFLTLADWTGMIETELFAQTYKSYGLATVRYPVLEVTARVEPFENGRGHTLRVLRAGKPRTRH